MAIACNFKTGSAAVVVASAVVLLFVHLAPTSTSSYTGSRLCTPCAIENRINSDSYEMRGAQFLSRYGEPNRVIKLPLNREDQLRFPEEIRQDLIEVFRDQDQIRCYVRTENTELIGFKGDKCDIILRIASPIPEFR